MADPAPDDGADVAPALFSRLAADPLADLLGIVLEQVRPGYARAVMTVGPQLLNAVGTAHGGATMALLDVVHAAVSNSHGTVAVAQDVHTEFLAPGRPGDRLVAEGTEGHRSRRTAVYRIEARAQDGRLVATALARGVRIGRDLGGVVVLAVPLPAMAGALEGLDVDPAATVTDLGSVKTPVLAELGPALGGRYVGGHPMCGTERSGHEATDPGLFTGARWALCLEPGTELPRWLRVAEVALAVGAEVVPVTAAEHDDAVAAISHVPHLLAAALATAAGQAGPLALALAAGSFRDGTRVIGSDPGFVTALVEGNAGPAGAALNRVRAH